MEMVLTRKPAWLKVSLRILAEHGKTRGLLNQNGLNIICEEAVCPNKTECWNRGVATFLILGKNCTRSCRFCNVATKRPLPVDSEEPKKVAEAVGKMALAHVVITSVTRDDLSDGGSNHWLATLEKVKNKKTTIEALIPDFSGSHNQIETVLGGAPDILGHNLETVPRLYSQIRQQSDYRRSLDVLKFSANLGFVVKTGIMVGLGESEEEIVQVMKDAFNFGCKIFTIGQYLQPSKNHLPICRYVHPDEFKEYKQKGLEIGFSVVESGPLVRSSYCADRQINQLI